MIPDNPRRTATPGDLPEDTLDYEREADERDHQAELANDREWLCGEPPEPDGECFRGGEAAAFEAEQQARIQRELKR
jgi:hypothetical protein